MDTRDHLLKATQDLSDLLDEFSKEDYNRTLLFFAALLFAALIVIIGDVAGIAIFAAALGVIAGVIWLCTRNTDWMN